MWLQFQLPDIESLMQQPEKGGEKATVFTRTACRQLPQASVTFHLPFYFAVVTNN